MLYIWHFQRDFNWTNTSTRSEYLIPINHHLLNTGLCSTWKEKICYYLIESTLVVWEYSLEQYLPKKSARDSLHLLTQPFHPANIPLCLPLLFKLFSFFASIILCLCFNFFHTYSGQMIHGWFQQFGFTYSPVVHTFLNYSGIRHMHGSIEWQGCLYIYQS